jgi:hypothetical protein
MIPMGTPHVHCMSQLPTAHEPADRAAGQLRDEDRLDGRARGAGDEKSPRRESKQA